MPRLQQVCPLSFVAQALGVSKWTAYDILRELERPITFSAYTITLLIAHIRSLGNRSIQSIENLLQLAPKPEQMLSLFTGAVLGTMVRNMREAINTTITTKVGKFHKHVSEFNGQEKKLLVSFLEEALQRATV